VQNAIATPISRPKSRYESSPSPDCHDDDHFYRRGNPAKLLPLSCCGCLQGQVSRPFSPRLVANRIAPDTHRDQAISDEMSIALAAVPPQRNVGARQGPMGFRTVAVACATPVKRGSLSGRPVICKQEAEQKEDPIRTMAFHQSQYWARSLRTAF
jgi:hypothetical protein